MALHCDYYHGKFVQFGSSLYCRAGLKLTYATPRFRDQTLTLNLESLDAKETVFVFKVVKGGLGIRLIAVQLSICDTV